MGKDGEFGYAEVVTHNGNIVWPAERGARLVDLVWTALANAGAI
jgi:hypothetical protein